MKAALIGSLAFGDDDERMPCVAGFGSQGDLLLGEVLAEAGLDVGLEVSWLPSYGPEMRSGTSNCPVRMSSRTIDSPLVTAPDVLVAKNEPSLRKFNDSGHVAEGATCNIFMVRNDTLIAPPVTENVLDGITRDSVMKLAHRELGLSFAGRPIDRSKLYGCDELFFTGTAAGIAPVVRVDHRPVGDGAIGAFTRGIEQLYFDAARGHLKTCLNRLTPVYQSQMNPEHDRNSLVG